MPAEAARAERSAPSSSNRAILLYAPRILKELFFCWFHILNRDGFRSNAKSQGALHGNPVHHVVPTLGARSISLICKSICNPPFLSALRIVSRLLFHTRVCLVFRT
jgi:hypothetical protein